jgi:hypothetical protein
VKKPLDLPLDLPTKGSRSSVFIQGSKGKTEEGCCYHPLCSGGEEVAKGVPGRDLKDDEKIKKDNFGNLVEVKCEVPV